MLTPTPPHASGDRFSNDEEAGRYYLDLLRDGSGVQKIEARFGLARVFENRGDLAAAAELYEANARAGVRDPGLYLHLSSLYRRQDRANEAGAALAFAEKLGTATGGRPRRAATAVQPRATPESAGSRRTAVLALSSLALLLAGGAFAAIGIPSSLTLWTTGSSDSAASDPLVAAQSTHSEPTAVSSVGGTTAGGTATAVVGGQPAESGQPTGCTFILGFADLRRAVGPDVVGDCIEDQEYAENGDARQRTTGGELVWRKTDNRSAFTDGSRTWMIGPSGLQSRPNEDRFAWEPFPLPPVLPGSVLPAKRLVTYYGNPLSKQMGILGEIPPDEMIQRLKQQLQAYAAANPEPARPFQGALELVAIVAQEDPGRDGLYRLRMDSEVIEEVIGWAEQNNFLIILDIQVGRSVVAPEIRSLLPFLRRPNVHLALDPEFAMRPHEKPGEEIGSHDADDVNVAIDMLAELVTAENIPPKVLLVHRFTEKMLTNYRKIKADSRVQVAVIMDGFGAPALKIDHYNAFVAFQRVQYTGIKLFYKQDKPLMSPKDVLSLEPTPDIVIYQ